MTHQSHHEDSNCSVKFLPTPNIIQRNVPAIKAEFRYLCIQDGEEDVDVDVDTEKDDRRAGIFHSFQRFALLLIYLELSSSLARSPRFRILISLFDVILAFAKKCLLAAFNRCLCRDTALLSSAGEGFGWLTAEPSVYQSKRVQVLGGVQRRRSASKRFSKMRHA